MKTMYRDRDLLDLAQGQPCLLRIPGVCNHDHQTTVAAHSNLGRDGKGKGLKAHDAYSVWACARCHTWLDESYAASAQEKEEAFERAFLDQIMGWTEIATNACLKPWRVDAARRALVWLESQERKAA